MVNEAVNLDRLDSETLSTENHQILTPLHWASVPYINKKSNNRIDLSGCSVLRGGASKDSRLGHQ